MENKEKEIIDTEDHEQPTPGVDIDEVRTEKRKAAERELDVDLTRYGAEDYLATTEQEDEKRFDRVITANNVKQWIFTIFTGVIIALAIADIGFGIGKLDNWVYLFGVLTAYEANEAREKKDITKEYKKTRMDTRNIVKSTLKFRNNVE